MQRRVPSLILGGLAIALAASRLAAATPTSPDRIAPLIETFLRWAIEGRDLPSDPPRPSPALPHRNCGGRLDPEHPPATVYVSWQLSAEAQHAACNWKYDVASHRAYPLAPDEAAAVAERISSGTVGPQERAFFHTAPERDGRLAVTAGYCWGSAKGTFAFGADGPVLIGELAIHGY
jgi:hypothetical protein